MRTVRLTIDLGPFIRGQRAVVLGQDEYGLIVTGKHLGGPNAAKEWNKDSVLRGVQENEVVDYVPEPPPLTLKEKIRSIWP